MHCDKGRRCAKFDDQTGAWHVENNVPPSPEKRLEFQLTRQKPDENFPGRHRLGLDCSLQSVNFEGQRFRWLSRTVDERAITRRSLICQDDKVFYFFKSTLNSSHYNLLPNDIRTSGDTTIRHSVGKRRGHSRKASSTIDDEEAEFSVSFCIAPKSGQYDFWNSSEHSECYSQHRRPKTKL